MSRQESLLQAEPTGLSCPPAIRAEGGAGQCPEGYLLLPMAPQPLCPLWEATVLPRCSLSPRQLGGSAPATSSLEPGTVHFGILPTGLAWAPRFFPFLPSPRALVLKKWGAPALQGGHCLPL